MIIYGSVHTDTEVELLRSNNLGIEVFANPETLDNPSEYHKFLAERIKGMVGVSMHGTIFDMAFASGDPLIVEVVKKRFIQCVQAAALHGINHLIFHSSYRAFYNGRGRIGEWYIKASIDFWKDFEHNIPDGMTVLLENVEDDDPEVFAEIIHGIDSPKIACCFDAAHAHVYSSWQLDDWIRILGGKIKHVHLSDNDGKSDLHLPLGQGNLPLASVIQGIMKHASSEVPFTLECDIPLSIDWLVGAALCRQLSRR